MQDNESVYYDILISLRQIIRCTDLHSKKLVKSYGLTGPQLIIIKVIAQRGEIVIGSLAKEVSLSQATVTNIVERLEQKGILYRKKTDFDKRRVVVTTTDKAHAILEQKPLLLDLSFVKNFEKLETWEKNMLISSLQRIASMMNESKSLFDPAFLSKADKVAEL